MEHRGEEYRRDFWAKEYPFLVVKDIITCGGRYKFGQRSFSFMYFNEKEDKLKWGPWRTFATFEAFVSYTCNSKCYSISFGSLWARDDVRLKDKVNVVAMERELFFDIDLNDYGHLRVCECGEKKKCCNKCWWVYISQTAMPILKYLMKDFLKCEDLRFYFSGKKGLHAHVNDARFMRLTKEQRVLFFRRMIDKYYEIDGVKDRVHAILDPVFDTHVYATQNQALVEFMSKNTNTGGYKGVGECIEYVKSTNQFPSHRDYDKWYKGCVREALFPRFDRQVTEREHLIKLPYVMHPDTGRRVLPIDETFLPE